MSQRLEELQVLRSQADSLRRRLESDALAAVVRGDEATARKAIARKLEAMQLIDDFDKRIEELRALQVTLRRDPVLEEIRQAMAAEDSAEYLLLAQGSLESSLSAGDDLDPAVFLTEFAQALSSLQVTQRMDAMSWIELLASLTTIAGEKQREWEAWEAATLEAIAFGLSHSRKDGVHALHSFSPFACGWHASSP